MILTSAKFTDHESTFLMWYQKHYIYVNTEFLGGEKHKREFIQKHVAAKIRLYL